MQEAQKTPAQPVDVKALMAEVRNRVEAKKQSGEYDPAEIRDVEDAIINLMPAREDGAEAELQIHHGKLQNLWNPKDFGVDTHRVGKAGELIVKAKRLLHKALSPISGILFAQQTKFNDEMIKALNILIPHHQALRERMPQAERRLDVVEDLGREYRAYGSQTREGFRKIQLQIDELKETANYLQRTTGKDHSRLDITLAKLQDLVSQQAQAGGASPDAAEVISQERDAARGASYVAFEDKHRGSKEKVQELQQVYLPIFKKSVTPDAPLVDLGCGRGEFLELAKDAGLSVKGVDLNPEMAAHCRDIGLDVQEGDAMGFLRSVPDNSLGGILAAQVIEHLSLQQLTEMVSLAFAKLKPGGALVAETVNPACLTTFCGAFYLDLTHNKPIHPEAARFLWQWAGLTEVDIMYLSPYPPEALLGLLPEDQKTQFSEVFNQNMDRLNQLLYSCQDYAVVGFK
jgi:SAM-dependent methyltransferase